MDTIFIGIVASIGIVIFISYILQCERCWIRRQVASFRRDDELSEPYINFKTDTEKLAFCQAIGDAMNACSKSPDSKECKNFNSSVNRMKADLDVLFEIYNRNVKSKEI